jgi:hypothetical protein
VKRDSLDRVRALVSKLPDVEEGTTFGFPAFKVGGKVFAWFPKKKEVEPGSLGVRMSLLEREHRVAAEPEIFYVTPHYRDYPSVLARPQRMSDAALRRLLESGHEFMVLDGMRSKARGAGNRKRPPRGGP